MPETFIHPEEIEGLLAGNRRPDRRQIEEILAHAREAKGLNPPEVAALLNLEDPDLWQEVFRLAKELKLEIYGRRIVLFAPFYVSNHCANDCAYCGFRCSNTASERRALTVDEVRREVELLERTGHKRLLMVYGEHPKYGVKYMAETIAAAYATRTSDPCGEIRRININAAPLDVPDYRVLKDLAIGTYQVFQETYHPGRYAELHPARTRKGDYAYRLYALHRAQEAGLDDVAVGALFGLYDWKFEVLGILYHALDMEKSLGVGPHTVSFPRLQPAINTPLYHETPYLVSDDDFRKLVAIVRLMVPYTGMILTAREKPELRHEMYSLGVSQIDGGTRIGIGGYSEKEKENIPERQQFTIYDTRSLDDVIRELIELDYIPSFCTACYRSHRTGEAFMNLAKHGHAKDTCQPNAILTLKEFLLDYASPETRRVGDALLAREIERLDARDHERVSRQVKEIEAGKRDLYF
ncbi:MAG: [FeFe] hydrogenase H-cluster radical SAM maturase HydG [Myxococcales bacterium]|nr:[FeFe] hydrogenase H-cluster radical SAM maturase HydG [Myxococcales bacterium]